MSQSAICNVLWFRTLPYFTLYSYILRTRLRRRRATCARRKKPFPFHSLGRSHGNARANTYEIKLSVIKTLSPFIRAMTLSLSLCLLHPYTLIGRRHKKKRDQSRWRRPRSHGLTDLHCAVLSKHGLKWLHADVRSHLAGPPQFSHWLQEMENWHRIVSFRLPSIASLNTSLAQSSLRSPTSFLIRSKACGGRDSFCKDSIQDLVPKTQHIKISDLLVCFINVWWLRR